MSELLFRDPKPADPNKPAAGAFTGTVTRVSFENDATGYRVLRVEPDGRRGEEQTWVGTCPAVAPGMKVRATGRIERDPKWGDQVRLESLVPVMPSTRDGIEKYLGSGLIPGIGKALAKRIVARFGEQTLDILTAAPERLKEIRGLGEAKVAEIARTWEEQSAVREIMVFLQQHGASPALATRIYRRYKERAVEVVSKYPYRLAIEVDGIGFKTADRIALAIGIPADSPDRAQAGTLHTLFEASGKGHCFLEQSELVDAAAAMLERDPNAVEYAIRGLVGAGNVRIDNHADRTAVFTTALHNAECRVAERIASLMMHAASAGHEGALAGRLDETVAEAVAAFEERGSVRLADAQREAVYEAARSKVTVITGGPGVGKTTIVRAVLSVFDAAHIHVRLAAPTGRAAKRMSEATGKEAVTIHRLLEYDPREHCFSRGRNNPIDAGAVIIDESSMLDVRLADSLFAAVADGARLILVGDVDQLPSVGPGAILRDVIESGRVPTVRLTEIFRQAAGSEIVEQAHRINHGEKPSSSASATGEFFVFERTEGQTAADLILELVTERIPKGFGIPASDVQVLTPMHKAETGTMALNAALQARLNPTGPTMKRGGQVFRPGDKVMQLKNDYDLDVFNGDVGRVEEVDTTDGPKLVVNVDGRRVEYEGQKLDNLTLAYAATIHKSQGSEYAAVVIPMLQAHYVMLSRNLLYTAVTRGKRLVVLVADPKAIKTALAETRREERRTLLRARLRGEL